MNMSKMGILDSCIVILILSLSPLCSAFAQISFYRQSSTQGLQPVFGFTSRGGESILYTRGGGDSSHNSLLESTTSSTQEHATTIDSASTFDSYSDIVASYINKENWVILSPRGKVALANLIESDVGIGAQRHVYADWPVAGVDDENKRKLTEQVRYTIFPI